MKIKTCLLRLSAQDERLIKLKSAILNTDRSKLLRDASYSYWDSNGLFNPDTILSLYKTSDEESRNDLVTLLVKFLRQKGYPHRQLSQKQLNKEMQKLVNTKCPLIDTDHFQTNYVGIPIANYFHPHMMKVKCLDRYRSPYEVFSDDTLLHDAINRWLQLGYKPTLSGIRRILRTRDGVRSVVNFRPVVAKYFYDTYCPAGGSVLDPCAGYGGRLVGLISTDKNLLYHGIDPCAATATGNTRLAGFFISQFDGVQQMLQFRFRFDIGCAEHIMPSIPAESYNLIFTSPPYFDTEKYDTVPNQSYLQYPDYPIWREKFLTVLLRESCRLCARDGFIVINVKNYKKYRIADDVLEIAKSLHLILSKTYHMRLTNSEFLREHNKPNWHTEPIFVFRK